MSIPSTNKTKISTSIPTHIAPNAQSGGNLSISSGSGSSSQSTYFQPSSSSTPSSATSSSSVPASACYIEAQIQSYLTVIENTPNLKYLLNAEYKKGDPSFLARLSRFYHHLLATNFSSDAQIWENTEFVKHDFTHINIVIDFRNLPIKRENIGFLTRALHDLVRRKYALPFISTSIEENKSFYPCKISNISAIFDIAEMPRDIFCELRNNNIRELNTDKISSFLKDRDKYTNENKGAYERHENLIVTFMPNEDKLSKNHPSFNDWESLGLTQSDINKINDPHSTNKFFLFTQEILEMAYSNPFIQLPFRDLIIPEVLADLCIDYLLKPEEAAPPKIIDEDDEDLPKDSKGSDATTPLPEDFIEDIIEKTVSLATHNIHSAVLALNKMPSHIFIDWQNMNVPILFIPAFIESLRNFTTNQPYTTEVSSINVFFDRNRIPEVAEAMQNQKGVKIIHVEKSEQQGAIDQIVQDYAKKEIQPREGVVLVSGDRDFSPILSHWNQEGHPISLVYNFPAWKTFKTNPNWNNKIDYLDLQELKDLNKAIKEGKGRKKTNVKKTIKD